MNCRKAKSFWNAWYRMIVESLMQNATGQFVLAMVLPFETLMPCTLEQSNGIGSISSGTLPYNAREYAHRGSSFLVFDPRNNALSSADQDFYKSFSIDFVQVAS
jgi:hypothetical protein